MVYGITIQNNHKKTLDKLPVKTIRKNNLPRVAFGFGEVKSVKKLFGVTI